MPSYRISASRAGGTCLNEFFHPVTIAPGDRTLVTTHFPGEEAVRDFGVPALSRYRVCLFCTASKLGEFARTGQLHFIHGLTSADLERAGVPIPATAP